MTRKWVLIALASALAAAVLASVIRLAGRSAAHAPSATADAGGPAEPADAIVVGSGIAGLSAAYELGRGGAHVVVIDMASIFGGHAVMATGDLSMVGTPFQEQKGQKDSPDLAYKDFMAWGEDADPAWVRYYVDHSREEIYDWVTSLGVSFETFATPAGNSVLRAHRTKGRGIGLVSPIFSECVRQPNISFRWNTRVDKLLTKAGRIVGVHTLSTRKNGERADLYAKVVVLATGGFQSNLDKVRESFARDVPLPERFLVGSGMNSMGSGLEIAREAGAKLTRLDHQWNYITGLPDPRYPGTDRGLHAVNPDSIWVNAEAKRFIAERSSTKFGFPVLARQKGATYWSIFDEANKRAFWVAGSDWSSFETIERLIFADPKLVKTADTIEALAERCNLPGAALRATVDHFNKMVETGVDREFQRFGPGKTFKPKKVAQPPYYCVQFFPLTRKSMGGVAIDRSGRVLDTADRVVPGLYAAGELTGLAGINGKAALEGTFLGPSIITGRVAGRAALQEIGRKSAPAVRPLPQPETAAPPSSGCQTCHPLATLVEHPRDGYWHFEKVHHVVVEKQFDCSKCHAELGPRFEPSHHRIDRAKQVRVCTVCHSGEDR